MNGHELLTATDSPRAHALADLLFPAGARRRHGAIWLWWERRRIAYNLIVGAVGGAAALWIPIVSTFAPGGTEFVPLEAFVATGIAANVCYTLGAMIESAALAVFGRGLLPIGPALWRMGLTFSCGLPLLPCAVVTVAALLSLLGLAI